MRHTKIEGIVNPDGTPGYSWNPFVGCLNGCSYCWARKCLARSKCELCRKFTPHWHAERMGQPYALKKPSTIAVCWMGDVWKYWDAADGDLTAGTLRAMMANLKKHTFLCLTREPIYYRDYWKRLFTDNVWLGVTVTNQEDVDRIGPDFAAVDHPNKFVSYEPMLGEIRDWGKLGRFGWLYMGALTDGRGRNVPLKIENCKFQIVKWTTQGLVAARERGAKVWAKKNLDAFEFGREGDQWAKETPWLKV